MSVLGILWIASHLTSFASSSAIFEIAGVANRVLPSLVRASTVLQSPLHHQFMASATPLNVERGEINRQQQTSPIKLAARLDQWTQELRRVVEPSLLEVRVIRVIGNNTTPDANNETAKQLTATASSQVACPIPQVILKPSRDRTAQFQVRIEDNLIAEVPTQQLANSLADQIRLLLDDTAFDPVKLQPAIVDGYPGATIDNQLVLSIKDDAIKSMNHPTDIMAIAWANNLRNALGVDSLPMADAQAAVYGVAETDQRLEGIASWYGPYFHGRLTANGERFNQNELTAAHPSLPFNTYLRVTNLKNNHTIVVRINDRGPYIGRRSLDLSRQAAICLGSEIIGVIPYRATILQKAPSPVPNNLVASSSSLTEPKESTPAQLQ
jgi:rare lipoprotein A (peptidoglycan hydrolase)